MLEWQGAHICRKLRYRSASAFEEKQLQGRKEGQMRGSALVGVDAGRGSVSEIKITRGAI